MAAELNAFIRDSDIVRELARPDNRLVMVIGGSDSGKTTLVKIIAHSFSESTGVGIVDLDMGQSHIGPPTSVAWGKIQGEFKEWEDIVCEDFYFTGTTTPLGSLLPTVVGAKLLMDRAVLSCEKVVIDTSGLIGEPAGRVLKQFKVDILSPDIVLALERSNELNHIIEGFRFQKRPRIYRIEVPATAKLKSATMRSHYRFEKFMKYFKDARVIEISRKGVGMRSTGGSTGFGPQDLRNRIVSFRDDENRDISLGIIEEVTAGETVFLIRTPMEGRAKISAIVVGKAELDRTNKELRNNSSKKR
ncbi:MAG TPA: hypothetical protein DCP92_06460 [Nitrospiraceae bacterium]|nr:hypothetical protein [Nitrospiraceae bacterium]